MRLRIGSWTNSRDAYVTGSTLMVQVALARHCGTCEDRIRTVKSRLSGSSLSYDWVDRDGSLYLSIELPHGTERIDGFLESVLGLRVRIV